MAKLTKNKIIEISNIKNEPSWMQKFRLKSLEAFKDLPNPIFGPELKIDFDSITYYKRVDDKVHNNWDNLDSEIKNTFDEIGLIEAEKKYLGGVGAQLESEVIYHNMIKEL